ncbi:MAG: DNA cytosine methyltransferase [Succiniclasticum sp.]|nr:DNA cytosine methyltransferase [Succiniclasticum sp.]
MKRIRNPAQISMTEEIIVDSFAGGGGASTGIEVATGRVVNIAINHDADAILMHSVNHPFTEHYQASVWDIDPEEVCKGRPVGLAWFSPDCKHFSKAKGSALVDKHIRGLAWIVLRWAATVRPRVIMLENVEEFQTWGPVRKGKPVKKKACKTFQQWKWQLMNLGYEIEHRELMAADYGAPTSRKRFVLVARCDGRPIVWPERTHAPADHPDVIAGKLLPWRSAAEIIDWTQPMYSIFATKQELKERYGVNAVRPLADNTMRRAIRGVDKFTIRSGKPFIVPVGCGRQKLTAFGVECNHSGGGHVSDICGPYKTITAKHTGGICEPVLSPYIAQNKFDNGPRSVKKPLSTITAVGSHELVTANLAQYHTEQTETARVNSLDAALPTVDASNRYAVVTAHLNEYYGNGQPIDISKPMRTVTSHDREALTAVHLDKYFGGGYSGCGNSADEPITTITSEPRHSICAAHIVEFKGQDKGQSAADPLRTITAGGGEFGVASVRIERYAPGAELGYWPEIRALLNRFCGYTLKEDEILLLTICGTEYFISDILLRMLTPRELYNAMGFPPDYIIDFVDPKTGKPYSKAAQVARCGNAVCPPMAEAMVRANLPEWCGGKIETMEQLRKVVAV